MATRAEVEAFSRRADAQALRRAAAIVRRRRPDTAGLSRSGFVAVLTRVADELDAPETVGGPS